MKKYSLLHLSFWLMALLAGLNLVGIAFYFYWTLWWFDILMHFLAGFSGGLFAIWFVFYAGLFSKRAPTILEAIFVSLLAIAIVGVVWEIFEYLNGITLSTQSYSLDVTYDIIADLVGAIVAGIVGVKEIFHTTDKAPL
jgi:VanZ family protein